MKKLLFSLLVLLLCSTSYFAYENADYLFKILNSDAATETVTFNTLSEDQADFHSITDLHFQQQKAVYTTIGKVKDNRIADYNLTLSFAGQEIIIKAAVKDDRIVYETGTTSGEILTEDPVFILDNNIAWFWQLLYDYYKKEESNIMKIFIPQLTLKNIDRLYKLEFEKTTVVEDMTNIYFRFNDQSGMLKVNEDGQVVMMMMSGVIMERAE